MRSDYVISDAELAKTPVAAVSGTAGNGFRAFHAAPLLRPLRKHPILLRELRLYPPISVVAGSIVSQGVGLAAGIQNRFSFKSLALSTLSAGMAKGLDKLGVGISTGSPFFNAALNGAIANAATQGVAVATGLQKGFDWTGIAAAGIAGGLMRGTGLEAFARGGPLNHVLNRTLSGMAGAIANAASRSLLDGTDFGDNILAALPDVIGQTIGNMVADRVSGSNSGKSGGNDDARAFRAWADQELEAFDATLSQITGAGYGSVAGQSKNPIFDANQNARTKISATPVYEYVASVYIGPPGQLPELGAPAWAYDSWTINWGGLGNIGSTVGDVVNLAENGGYLGATWKGQKILSNASPLWNGRMAAIATAGKLDEAAALFKDANGKTALALAESSAKYGRGLKMLPYVGVAATVVEEGAYLAQTYDAHPDKKWLALGATATNVAGDIVFTSYGTTGGAYIGGLFAPWTFGLSIPVGAAIGGVGGHLIYDDFVKPQVRVTFTGVNPNGQ